MGYKRYSSEKEIPNGIVDVKKKTLKTDFEIHWHDFFEATFCVDGCGYANVNGKRYDIKPGTVFLLSPTDYHEIIVEKPIVEITAMINSDIIPSEIRNVIISKEEPVTCIFFDDERKRVETLFEMLYSEFRWHREYRSISQKNIISLLSVMIVRRYDVQRGKISAERVTGKKNERNFKRAMAYILMNFNKNPSLTEISEYVGYSNSYFSRQFHEIYGVPYKEYLRKLKLGHAKKLLISGDMSIDEISASSGYDTLQIFLADFKKTFGETPTAFKKRYYEEYEKQRDDEEY